MAFGPFGLVPERAAFGPKLTDDWHGHGDCRNPRTSPASAGLLDLDRFETTAIYSSAIGDEERNLARRAWSWLEPAIRETTNFAGAVR